MLAVGLVVGACGRIAFEPSTSADPDAAAPPDPADVCPTYAPTAGHDRWMLVGAPLASWADAAAACEASGGRLFVPRDRAAYDRVLALGPTELWLGITDQLSEGTFVAPALAPEEPFFLGWLPGEPNSGNGAADEDCVMGYLDGLNDEGCGTPKPYRCECAVPTP